MKAKFLIAILLFVLPSLSAQSVSKEQLKKLNDIVGSYYTELDNRVAIEEEKRKGKPQEEQLGWSYVVISPFIYKYACISYEIRGYIDPIIGKSVVIDREGNVVVSSGFDLTKNDKIASIGVSSFAPEFIYSDRSTNEETVYDAYLGKAEKNDSVRCSYFRGDCIPRYKRSYSDDGLNGIVDGNNGKVILPRKYHDVDMLCYGLFKVLNDEYRCALSDSNGVFLTDFIYDGIKSFDELYLTRETIMSEPSNGRAFAAMLKSKWGVIDNKGKVLVPLIFDDKYNYPQAGFWNGELAFVYGLVNNEGYVCDGKGNKVCGVGKGKKAYFWQNSNVVVGKIEGTISQIDTIYDAKGDVTDRLAVNKNLVWHFKDSKWTLKNGKGKKIAGPFDHYKFYRQGHVENVFVVGNGDKWGMIDNAGKILIPIEKLRVDFNGCGNVEVQENKEYSQIYSYEGKQLTEEKLANDFVAGTGLDFHRYGPKQPEARWFKNTEGKWGLCRLKDMKVIVPFVCDTYPGGMSSSALKFGMATAFYKGRWYFINELGEGLPDEAYQQNK